MPGESSKVRIRGISSFQNNDPLYIVDGVPTTDITTLNPADIESMSVLKDAGSASVYGSRASNGVIIVSTKKGGQGVKVNYDMTFGTQYPGKGPQNLLNTQEYADLQWLVYKNDRLDGTFDGPDEDLLPDSEIHPIYGSSANAAPTLPSWAANTDWFDAMTDNAGIQNHDLSLSGGNEKARFFAGFGYFKQDGIIIHSYNKRYSGRFNSEFTFLNDRVKIGENLTMSFRDFNLPTNLAEGSPIQMGSYRTQPIIPVVVENDITGTGSAHNFVAGDWGGTGIIGRLGNSTNVVADQTRNKDNFTNQLRLIGSAYIDIQLLKGLNFRSTVGGTYSHQYQGTFTFATYERAENTNTSTWQEQGRYDGDWVWTNTLNLNKTFGQHTLNAVVGYEAVKYGIGRNMQATRAGYFSDKVSFRTLTNAQSTVSATSNFLTPTALISIFAKADYQYADKYLLSATVRRDGASVFDPDNRYGVFPSVSAGWRIGEEAFMDGLPWLAELKIRGSYGTMGNMLPVRPENAFYTYSAGAGSSYYDLGGTGNSALQGFRPTQIGNPAAKWETNVTANIGFEAGLFDNKVNLVFDWFTKRAVDLLFNPELPGTSGGATQPYVNVAEMKNTGVDIELGYKNNFGDLGFSANAVFTSYKNEIVKISEGVNFFDAGYTNRLGYLSRNMEGQPVSAFYGYKVIGLFQSDADIAASPVQDGSMPGALKFANNDDSDNEITPDDRQVIGNPNPKFTYGLNLAFNYKNFDLSTFIYGSYGNDILNWNKWWTDFWPSFAGQKSEELLYDSWTPERTNTDVPIATNQSTFSTNTQLTSYLVEDGSYLRMKNLTLGYTIPESMLSKVKIKSLRIYVQAINLFTITKYTGLDPEISSQFTTTPDGSPGVRNDQNMGIDYGNFPTVRQFLFGLNLGL
jgi:TonB-linked SusC/RagA family outer membrane protein